ncbi:MAG TPA: tandem-95 repeat protein, partial [Methylophilaceae bacterium]|nr:tandem-95 repeat protein [Methylophilaceae bacterium]
WTYTLNNSNATVQGLNAGATLTDSFTVTSVDGTAKVVTVTITGSNDAPTLNAVSSIAYTDTAADDTFTNVTGTLAAADVDTGTTLTYGISTGASGSTTIGGITYDVSKSSTYGTLYMKSTTGQYVFVPNDGSIEALKTNTSTSFTVNVSDGSGGTATQTLTVNLTGANDTPTLTADTKTMLEDGGTATGNVLTNDSDRDGDTLSVTQFVVNGTTYSAGTTASIAGVGSLVINSNGSYSFTPTANYGGTVPSVTYTVSDGSATATSTLSIAVTPVADAPTLSINGTSTTGGTTTPPTIPTGTGLTMVYSAAGTNSVDTTSAGNLTTFETAIEASTATSTTTATDVVVAQTGNVADSAYRFNGYVYLTAGNTYTLGGYRDDTLLIKIGGTQVYGSAFDTYGNFTATTFTPGVTGFYSIEVDYYNGSGVGSLDLNVSVNGGTAVDFSTANFQLYPDGTAIAASGASFTANNDGGYYTYSSAAGNEDTSIPLGNISASLNDTDGSESLAVVVSAIPVGAVLTDGTHTFTATTGNTSVDVSTWNLAGMSITPPANYNGTINLTITATATDPGGSPATATTTATLPITVLSVNDAPSGTDNTINIVEDQGYTLKASDFGFSDVDGNSLQAVKIVSLPTGGALYLANSAVSAGAFISIADINAGKLTYVPAADSTTNRSFTFQVQDDGGTANGGVDTDPTANTVTFNIAAGTDMADKGRGNDSYSLALNAGNASVTDTGRTWETDTITQTTTGTPTFSTFNFARYGNNLEYTEITGANQTHLTFLNQYAGDAIERIVFSAGGTYLGFSLGTSFYTLNTSGSGSTGNDILAGSSADDVLNGGGGSGTDLIFGGAGADTITATGGTNLLVGGVGDDTITGGTGADTYVFGMADGNDTITDSGGTSDRIVFDANGASITGLSFLDSNTASGAGDLTITYNGQQITVTNHFAGSNIETLTFSGGASYGAYSLGSGAYTLSTDDTDPRTSSAGVNTILAGSSAADTLTGNSGNDLLFGGAGNDTLSGGSGSDLLVGGAGNDSMTGGIGADVFKWDLADAGTAGSPAVDRVTDFDTVASSDKLDLRDLLSGEDSVGGNLQNYLHFEKSGSDTIIHVSTSGGFSSDAHAVGGAYSSGAENQQIVLSGVDLTAGFSTDQQVIQNLLTNNKLVTD